MLTSFPVTKASWSSVLHPLEATSAHRSTSHMALVRIPKYSLRGRLTPSATTTVCSSKTSKLHPKGATASSRRWSRTRTATISRLSPLTSHALTRLCEGTVDIVQRCSEHGLLPEPWWVLYCFRSKSARRSSVYYRWSEKGGASRLHRCALYRRTSQQAQTNNDFGSHQSTTVTRRKCPTNTRALRLPY